ncbi:uncharacterized protein VTP21DRAFT_3613 [Calcarisporiella thermophila]|uniref:uncharacterized protein n=1 Tax=Calcarisporiella thermophila TaxID=911321 RepID=UPI003742A099
MKLSVFVALIASTLTISSACTVDIIRNGRVAYTHGSDKCQSVDSTVSHAVFRNCPKCAAIGFHCANGEVWGYGLEKAEKELTIAPVPKSCKVVKTCFKLNDCRK